MTVSISSRVAGISRAAAPLVVVSVIATVLLLFPPTQYSFYPQCPIYRYLHIQCPGCGTTRAIATLLRGHLVLALRLNALTTLLMPPAIIYGFFCYYRFLQHKAFSKLQVPSAAIYSAVAVAVIFAFARNL
jgi:hypothetical protein